MQQASVPEKPVGLVDDEQIVAPAPMVVRRFIKFGDTDAAGVVYSGRFLDFALEAFDTLLRVGFDLGWPQQEASGVGTPAVSFHLEFSRSLRAGDQLDIEILIDRIGGGSFTVRTVGRNARAEDVFYATMIFASVTNDDRKSVKLPDWLRSKLEAYVASCEAGKGA